MTNSTFVWDDRVHSNLAAFYNEDGSIGTHYRYTSLAATSLYTSLSDMELFVQAHFEGRNKENRGRPDKWAIVDKGSPDGFNRHDGSHCLPVIPLKYQIQENIEKRKL